MTAHWRFHIACSILVKRLASSAVSAEPSGSTSKAPERKKKMKPITTATVAAISKAPDVSLGKKKTKPTTTATVSAPGM